MAMCGSPSNYLVRGAQPQGAALRHRLGCVEDQVEQHLLDLRAVGPEGGRSSGTTAAHLDALLLQLVPREQENVVDDLLRRAPAP